MPATLCAAGIRADILLADLGFSSQQMDDPARGFTFREDAPLDMRYDRTSGATAAQLLSDLTEADLADVIFRYGEEPLARKIARIVVREREKRPILTTAELVAAVREAYGARARTSRIHPATRTFMALRIAVNDELGALEALLDSVVRGAEDARANGGWMTGGARVGIISFHSLEDRLVKRTFATLEKRGLAKRLTKKPVTARAQEVHANPRARSAKLRVVRLGGAPES
jgi:16S rRNA (cytosine1402-N4)-methyltransferase